MRTPLSVMFTLTVVSACSLVGITASPAAAACNPLPPVAQQISDTPWPQQLWDYSKLPATGGGVKVAILDSGVDTKNSQLDGKVIAVKDYLRSVPSSEDCVGHGTGVAGLIVGTPPPSGNGFRGLAPEARIVSARISEKTPGHENAASPTETQMADAVYWAMSQKVQIINLSLAYTDGEAGLPHFKQAIHDAVRSGVVVVAAVGNSFKNGNPTPYPAAWDGVIGVAAVGPQGQRLEESGTGSFVDIAAPGVDIVMPNPGSGHVRLPGTSFAAPLVSATAALIFSRYPGITGPQVIKRLLATADPAPGGRNSPGWGAGIVNPMRAITEPIDDLAPVDAKALPGPSTDPHSAVIARRVSEEHENAWWLAGIGSVAAMVAVALMIALPAGIRRRWRAAGSDIASEDEL